MTTTRTIRDLEGNHHGLEVGRDVLLLDGRPCTFLRITHEHIQIACADTAHPITLATGSFWRDLAGAAPSAQDAGELLAHRLAAWVARLDLLRALQSYEGLSSGSALPAYRLDSLTEQVLQAFDGTEATTRTLARILKQPAEIIYDWATRLGLSQPPITDEHEAFEQQASPETEEPRTTGPLESLPPTDSPREAPFVGQKAGPKKPASEWFRWTPERLHRLEETIEQAGGLEQMTQPVIKRLAHHLDWPWKSIEYQIGKRKRERPKEAQPEPATPEEDRRETASGERSLLHAS